MKKKKNLYKYKIYLKKKLKYDQSKNYASTFIRKDVWGIYIHS